MNNEKWHNPPKHPEHINKYLLQLDGDMWMCADISFVNIQESNCAFGRTPNDALSLFQGQELARLKDSVASILQEEEQ